MEVSKVISARIHNRTKSCIVMFLYSNGVWTLPSVIIPAESNPVEHIDSLLEYVAGEFVITSVTSIIEGVRSVPSKDKEHHSIIYDVQYEGKIVPTPAKDSIYVSGRWMPLQLIVDKRESTVGVTYSTGTYVDAKRINADL